MPDEVCGDIKVPLLGFFPDAEIDSGFITDDPLHPDCPNYLVVASGGYGQTVIVKMQEPEKESEVLFACKVKDLKKALHVLEILGGVDA